MATGSLTFDANGNLTSPTAPAQVPISITGLADGANDLNINWNLATNNGTGTPLVTQYATTSAVSASTQDGVPASQVTQVSIANGGAITAQFSDGNQVVVGQLALASVSNPDSLIAAGQNNYEVGADTATPVIGVPGTGTLGAVEGGSLEASTVDIATEFTNLIVYQNSYEANSKVISTLDQMTQNLLNLQTLAMNASDVLQRFGELPFVLELELGTLSMTIGDIFQLQEGSVLRTDHPAGAPFPLFASNVKLAEAEVIVIDDTVSVRVQKNAAEERQRRGKCN